MKKFVTMLVLAAVCGMVIPPTPLYGQGQSAFDLSGLSAATEEEPRFVSNEVLIQYEAGTDRASMFAARNQINADLKEEITSEALRNSGAGPIELVTLPSDVTVAEAIRSLENNPAVAVVEPNWIYNHQATINDPRYLDGSMWGMYGATTTPFANQFGSHAGTIWELDYLGSSNIVIGVIDEGIQFSHPDLQDNFWTNPFDPVDGIDNDGNGFIDDVRGWDFVNNDNTVYDGTFDDHGTHVAGTIGAKGGNGIGVAGVSWNVTLISGKFLGTGGGTTANAIRAVDYFTDLKTRHGLNIAATSNSWGGGGFSQLLLDAIVRAANQNILFIAAAGNNGRDIDAVPFYPANYDTTAGAGYDAVMSIANINSSGLRSSSSNFGLVNVDFGAPGSSILSTVPVNSYAFYSGTSMATPHVSGTAALYASVFNGVRAQSLKDALMAGAVATPTASMSGITVTGGRLNITALSSPNGVRITTNSVLSRDGGGNIVVTVTVRNEGNAPANSVVLTLVRGSSTDGAASVDGTPVPQSLGTIPAGGTATATVTFAGTAGVPSGFNGVVRTSGTYTGVAGNFTQRQNVVVP